MKSFYLLLCVGLLMLSGCVHYSYKGESLTPTESAKIYSDKSKVDSTYEVLGKAVVYGDYQDVSRERLTNRLIEEAKANGADGVLITAQQVVPNGSAVNVDPEVNMIEATSSSNANSMNHITRDFDGGYGQAFSDGKPQNQGVKKYRRIIRAEFIKFTNAEAKTEALTDEKTEK